MAAEDTSSGAPAFWTFATGATGFAAAAVSAVLAWLVWGWWMNQRIDDQEGRNGYLRTEIQQLEGKLKEIKDLETTKAKLLARKQIIEQLQASRSQMVHLFDELVRTIPDGVRLASIKQTGDQLALEGVAQANGDVANYMRNLDASNWMQRSDLLPPIMMFCEICGKPTNPGSPGVWRLGDS